MKLKEQSAGVTKALVDAVPDLVGLAGLASIVAGVYQLAGAGWALVVFGLPLFGGYVWRLARAARLRRA